MAERPHSVDEDNAVARERALARIRERARIFREVLGSVRGQLVLNSLRQNFGFESTAGIPPNRLGDDGHTDSWQTARKLGEYSVIRWIEIQLEWRESDYVDTGSGGT
jgi:hypothetical protein